MFFGMLALLLIAVPFLSYGTRERRIGLIPVAGLTALLYIIVLSILAYRT